MNSQTYLKPLIEEAKEHNSASEFIAALKKTIHKEECGCIWSKWIRLPGLPLMCRGGNNTPDDEVIQNAIGSYKSKYDHKKVEDELHNKYPDKQIYLGELPCDDVLFEGEPDRYFYVLKDRKRHRKYQILEAILEPCDTDGPLNLIEFWRKINEKDN